MRFKMHARSSLPPTPTMDSSIPCLSFIGIVDFSQEARWLYMTSSVSDLLGYEPHELRGRPSLELVHPDEASRVRKLHYDTIRQDKAACLVYLRMKHKDPHKGYVLCAVVRVFAVRSFFFSAPFLLPPSNISSKLASTIVHNVTIGSVSYANSSSKAMHNASTAQEITVLSPTPDLEFRRWHDPSPMPPSTIPSDIRRSLREFSSRLEDSDTEQEDDQDISYDPLPSQSFRTAFILDRFSLHCSILYMSNDLMITANSVEGRSFFDFVSKHDESKVRTWIDTVKGWGVNERGQPSDGGFGFGKFNVLVEGRDYLAARAAEPPAPPRQRHGSHASSHPSSYTRVRQSRSAIRGSGPSHTVTRPTLNSEGESVKVDAIFSAHSDGLMVILRRAA
ncbi:hypothetical protein D9757_007018 [Collybiopsis confluens]|uniref:PAS domain-containing protein n=1 Tax=Collybiopsis confluens TaxID=2823264 RepID=A0A8H5M4L8_9AGAR|nr:hypothetical protein D9757_007018 [Collybiopsis confluens]